MLTRMNEKDWDVVLPLGAAAAPSAANAGARDGELVPGAR